MVTNHLHFGTPSFFFPNAQVSSLTPDLYAYNSAMKSVAGVGLTSEKRTFEGCFMASQLTYPLSYPPDIFDDGLPDMLGTQHKFHGDPKTETRLGSSPKLVVDWIREV